jgi:hypothetical protein
MSLHYKVDHFLNPLPKMAYTSLVHRSQEWHVSIYVLPAVA